MDLFSLAVGRCSSAIGSRRPDGVARNELRSVGRACKLRATAKLQEGLGEADDAVAVLHRAGLADASVRTELLAELARVTGGRAYQLPRGAAGRPP